MNDDLKSLLEWGIGQYDDKYYIKGLYCRPEATFKTREEAEERLLNYLRKNYPVKKENKMIEMTEVNERKRVYWFPNNTCNKGVTEYGVVLENVIGICVRPSGTHRLKTADGHLHIVPTGWHRIEIEADDWSF